MPDLFDLIFKTKDKSLDQKRWSLLKWVLNFDVKFIEKLKTRPKEFVVALATIKYLLQNGAISLDEADAILLTEEMVRSSKTQPKRNISEHLNVAWIKTAHLYVKMYIWIWVSMELCGLFSHSVIIVISVAIDSEN